MKKVYVDMDDTLCDFISPFKKGEVSLKYPQSKIGFFLDLEPLEGAIEGMKTLQTKYTVYILTRPSIKNTHCYTEKAEWIKRYLGEEMLEVKFEDGFGEVIEIGKYYDWLKSLREEKINQIL